MDVKSAEFFITNAGTDEVYKFNGVVFERQGRLFGTCFHVYSGGFEWLTYDIKTGLCVSCYESYLAIEKATAYFDESIKCFDEVLTEADEKHFGSMIKKAYDEHPEIKRQVFG